MSHEQVVGESFVTEWAEKPVFEEHLARIFGSDLDAFLNHPPLGEFIRVNTRRTSLEACEGILSRYGFEFERVGVLPDCLRILKMPYDPSQCLHHFAGLFVKQSLSSQLPVRFMDLKPGQNVIDLCAAPGSKTTQIAQAMEDSGRLYVNDLAGKRMTPLAARLDATGVSCAVLYNTAAERLIHYLPERFDRVLADVPCSGLGHAQALGENQARFERCAKQTAMTQLQYRILLTACRLVRPGGRVVYSTCSLDPRENEAVVEEIVRRLPFRVCEIPDVAGVTWANGQTEVDGKQLDPNLALTRRVRPWENDSQGFYVAVLEKTDALHGRLVHEAQIPETPTFDLNAPEVAPILENIKKYYGVDPSLFADFRFVLSTRGIQCLDACWSGIEPGYQRAGMGLAKKRGGIWRLSHSMIQRLGPAITRNVVELNSAQLREICESNTTYVAPSQIESPYPVLSCEDLGPFATAYDMGNGQIRWKCASRYYSL